MGTNTTSQFQVTNWSNFKGKETNCKAFTAKNNSNSNERSCLTAHTQAPTLATEPNIKGINTKTQRWRLEVKLSQANNSNINNIKCKDSEINMALNCV